MQKQKRKKLIAIFLIIYIISIGSSWGYFFYQQDADHDKRVIREFSSSDSKFSELYEVENRRLVNVARESYIFPNDRLEYRFTIVNPLEHQIRVLYEFEVFRTGDRIHDESGEWYFQDNDVEHRAFEFFLPDEGPYDLKANWIFYNQTNGEKYAQYAPLERDIQVLSLANKLLDDGNQLTYHGLIAASVVGIGTIMALGFSVYFSNKHTKQLESQFHIEKRAWLGATTMMTYDNVSNTLTFPYKNYGKLPAKNIREYNGHSTNLISRNDISSTRPEITHISTVFPDQEANYFMSGLDQDTIKTIENKTGHLFIWIEIDYTYSSGATGLYGVIFELQQDTGHFLVRDEWME